MLSKSQPLRDVLATVRRIVSGLPVLDREEREELLVESSRRRFESQHQHASGWSCSPCARARCSAT